ncbi:MAG: Potassium channel [Pycnora praestabilis]|nr:MAG: Potassium channel [Pycnora praestabilis]
MLQTINLLIYLEIGAAVYAHIEGWNFLDALYWADFTLLTIGIGDVAPTTHLGRSLLFPYAIGGIVILALLIASIRKSVLERSVIRVSARMIEKDRRRHLKKMLKSDNGAPLRPISAEQDLPRTAPHSQEDPPDRRTEYQRRKEEFTLMRKIKVDAARQRHWMTLLVSGSTWAGLWFVGAAIFKVTERKQDWSYFESTYFAYVSLLTIGYGDIYPTSNSGKHFFVLWSLLAILALTILISSLNDVVFKEFKDLTEWIGNATTRPDKEPTRPVLEGKTSKGQGYQTLSIPIRKIYTNLVRKSWGLGITHGDTGRRNHLESAIHSVDGKSVFTEAGELDDEQLIASSCKHYHVILIREISKVIHDFNEFPSRKYIFHQWAWYLKLIGEDEFSLQTHRELVARPKYYCAALWNSPVGERNQNAVKWSWLGTRSPLKENESKPAWVLKRLLKMLDRELRDIRQEEEEMTGCLEQSKGRLDMGAEDGEPEPGRNKGNNVGSFEDRVSSSG